MTLHISKDISLPLDAVTQTFGVLAKRGTGKTYTASVMAEEMLKANQQIVALDPTGAWYGLRSGFPVVIFGGEHADVPLEESAGEVIARAIVENGFSAVLDFSLFRKGQMIRFMVAFAETLYRLNRAPLHLFVDEADAVAPQMKNYGGDENRMLGAMEDIVRRGRKRGIGCTLITQRPAVLNKNVLTQCEVLISLRLVHPKDIDAIEEWVNVHGDPKVAKTMIESLPSLPIGTAWIWAPGWGDIFKRVEIRKRETFDSGATPKPGETPKRPAKMQDIDVAALGEQIKATVEKAKENDPAELKRTIAELKRKVENLERSSPKVEQKTVEVPILDDDSKRALSRLTNVIQQAQEGLHEHQKVIAAVFDFFRNLEAIITKLKPSPLAAPISGRSPVASEVYGRHAQRAAGGESSNGDLGRGERAVLIAAAQHPDGVTDEQIAVLTGYKKTSRSTFKQRLMSQGYLANGGNGYVATESGITALGNDFEPLPTGAALREHWLERLSGGELDIFKVLVEMYPNILSKSEIENRCNYKKTSVSTFCQRLSARRLIESRRDIDGGSGVRANPELFE